jgi:putative drug exporter of the RND superfamily
VVELAKQFTPTDIFPALVVYERADAPITPADQAKVAADARRFAAVEDVALDELVREEPAALTR